MTVFLCILAILALADVGGFSFRRVTERLVLVEMAMRVFGSLGFAALALVSYLS